MSDEAISQLNATVELLTPAIEDLLAITHVSDTTEATTGTTKPIRVDNLGNNSLDRIVCLDNEVVCVDNQVVFI